MPFEEQDSQKAIAYPICLVVVYLNHKCKKSGPMRDAYLYAEFPRSAKDMGTTFKISLVIADITRSNTKQSACTFQRDSDIFK